MMLTQWCRAGDCQRCASSACEHYCHTPECPKCGRVLNRDGSCAAPCPGEQAPLLEYPPAGAYRRGPGYRGP